VQEALETFTAARLKRLRCRVDHFTLHKGGADDMNERGGHLRRDGTNTLAACQCRRTLFTDVVRSQSSESECGGFRNEVSQARQGVKHGNARLYWFGRSALANNK